MRLTLGKKLVMGFGVIVVLMGVSYFINHHAVYEVINAQQASEDLNNVSSLMVEKIVDHYKWLDGLNHSVTHNADRVEVALDSTKCALGHWMCSDEAKQLSHEHPEVAQLLTDIVPHHDKLHDTARQIDELMQEHTDEADAQASAIFLEQTPVHLHAVQEKLNSLSDTLSQQADKETEHLHSSLERMSTVSLAMFVIASILAVVIGWLVSRSVIKAVRLLLAKFQSVASGDLSVRCELNSKDELGDLSRGFNTLVDTLAGVIQEIDEAAREVAGASTQIAASSEEMAAGMGEQAGQVTQISSAVEEMSASIAEVTHKSSEAVDNANQAGEAATQGGAVVDETIHGMSQISEAVTASAASVSELGKRGDQIGQIIDVINDIADQTNLLALNAAIEAARAGEHGRGFAVVADEVRKLADRTTNATEEIAESITAIQTETEQAVERMNAGTEQVQVGVEKATRAGTSLSKIVKSAKNVAEMIRTIASSAEQQSVAAEEVSRNIQTISSVTSQASEGASQSACASAQLSAKAEQLQQVVGRFKLDKPAD